MIGENYFIQEHSHWRVLQEMEWLIVGYGHNRLVAHDAKVFRTYLLLCFETSKWLLISREKDQLLVHCGQ
jgi:hypothetical protein